MTFDGFGPDLQRELAAVLNRNSVDAKTDTPDFILAEMLIGTLTVYRMTRKATQQWLGEGSKFPHNDTQTN